MINKFCLILGATGGLGKEVVRELAKENNLILVGRDKDCLKCLSEELKSKHFEIKTFICDFNDIQDTNMLITILRDYYIDILINCAGVFPVNPIENISLSDFDECINVNIKSPFFIMKSIIEQMRNREKGLIINIGSSSSYNGFKNTSLYCLSKHALLGLNRSLVNELGEHNIKMIIISPGSFKSEMSKKVTWQNYDTFMEPNDIAKYISFIISMKDTNIVDEIKLNRMHIQ